MRRLGELLLAMTTDGTRNGLRTLLLLHLFMKESKSIFTKELFILLCTPDVLAVQSPSANCSLPRVPFSVSDIYMIQVPIYMFIHI